MTVADLIVLLDEYPGDSELTILEFTTGSELAVQSEDGWKTLMVN